MLNVGKGSSCCNELPMGSGAQRGQVVRGGIRMHAGFRKLKKPPLSLPGLSIARGLAQWRAACKTWSGTNTRGWEVVDLNGWRVYDLGDRPTADARQQNLRFQGQPVDWDAAKWNPGINLPTLGWCFTVSRQHSSETMNNPISQEMQAAFVIDDFSKMRKLITDGADVNSVDARDGSTILVRAIVNNDIEMVQFLIDHGVDLNKPGPGKMAPLHCVAEYRFIEAGKLLLEAGAWVDPLDQFGATPLAYAMSDREEGFLEMARLLISYGANKDITNKDGVLLIDVYSNLYGDNVLKTL